MRFHAMSFCKTCRLILASCLSLAPAAYGLDARGERISELLDRSGAQLAWRLPLPVSLISPIGSLQIVDGTLYAINKNGMIRAVDAASGRFLWSAGISSGGETIWGPTIYFADHVRQLLFTTYTEAVFLAPETGFILKRLSLPSPATAASVAVGNNLFCPAVNSRVWCVLIKEGYSPWQLSTHGPIEIAPIYLPEQDNLVAVDDGGYVNGFDSTGRRQFTTRVGGRPRGWIVNDKKAVYLTTASDSSAVKAVSCVTGEPVREPYRMNGRPSGGPTVTKTSVYQSISDGGVHRIALVPDGHSWFDPHARTFLAEWPGRTVLLRLDGSVEFVETATGQSVGVLEPGAHFTTGVSNPSNDVAIAGNEAGEVWCMRPASAGPVDTAGFHVATSQPTTRPVHTRPAAVETTVFSYAPSGGSPAAKPANAGPGAGAAGGAAGAKAAANTPPNQQNQPQYSQRARVAGQLNRALGGKSR